MNQRPIPSPHHARERGGVAILVVFTLLVLMTVAGVTASRGALRELSITGNENIGRRAYEVADSGLDWTITWGSPNALLTTDAQRSLRMKMNAILDSIDNETLRDAGPDYPASGWDVATTDPTQPKNNVSNVSGSYRVYLTPAELATAYTGKSDANFNLTSSVTPTFILEARFLGQYAEANTGQGLTKSKRSLWLVRSLGLASIDGSTMQFRSTREAIMEYIN